MNRSSAARLESGVEGLGGFSCSDNRYVQQSWANNAGEMSLGGKFVRASLACVRSLLSPKTPLQTMSIRSSGKTQEFATEAEDSLRCSCHGALREKKIWMVREAFLEGGQRRYPPPENNAHSEARIVEQRHSAGQHNTATSMMDDLQTLT